MTGVHVPAGSLRLARRAGGLRPRLLLDEQERVASEAEPRAEQEQSLYDSIPSALISTEQRAAALAVGGAPAWSRRLRRIDDLTDSALSEVEGAWRQLAHERRQSAARFTAAWRERARAFDFAFVNELIRRHNLYYPIERRLPMDVRTGDFVGPGGREFRRQPLDAAWVLDRFPPDLAAALG